MPRDMHSSAKAFLVLISVAFGVGGAVGLSKTAPKHQMLKPAAQPVPPYNTDLVFGMRNVLCTICVFVTIVPRCFVLYDKYLDWLVSN